mgnify:CR=1 FL=1
MKKLLVFKIVENIEKYKNDLIVIKYGGNVLIDRNVFNNFITDLSVLNRLGLATVVVHGGGPRIKRELEKSNIKSKFIRGLRVTDKNIINIVKNSFVYTYFIIYYDNTKVDIIFYGIFNQKIDEEKIISNVIFEEKKLSVHLRHREIRWLTYYRFCVGSNPNTSRNHL